jgi:hypothetical protein
MATSVSWDVSPESSCFSGARPGLRRDVRPFAALDARVGQLRQSEVQDLDPPVLRHHDVLGLQSPVNDTGFVGAGETFGHLGANRKDSLDRKRAGEEELSEGLALDQLHRDVRDRVGSPDVLDRDDVGVV